MAGTSANARIWLNADVYRAPLGTTLPTNIATALNAAFLPVGLLSEDGASESRDSDVTDHFAWGGALVRRTKSKHTRTIKFTMLEDNPVVQSIINPGSTAATAAGITTRTIVNPTTDIAAYVLQTVDGTVTRRRAIPRAEVSEVADITYSDSEMSGYEVTLTIYPDSSGVLYLDITNDPQAVVP